MTGLLWLPGPPPAGTGAGDRDRASPAPALLCWECPKFPEPPPGTGQGRAGGSWGRRGSLDPLPLHVQEMGWAFPPLILELTGSPHSSSFKRGSRLSAGVPHVARPGTAPVSCTHKSIRRVVLAQPEPPKAWHPLGRGGSEQTHGLCPWDSPSSTICSTGRA